MSSESLAVEVRALRKVYQVFDTPSGRLWQMLFNRRKFYREHVALEDITFSVAKGETVGVIGRNGSGKSTLLSIICGTLPPTSGRVHVHGRVAALLELGAGFNPELTGRENIQLCARIYGLSDVQVEEREPAIIAFADIGRQIDEPVKTYSSGMFTRLAFAVIAHVDADVLVIDEALAVGDAYFVQKCMRHLRGFQDRGGTLLFVSHDMGSVAALCDRAIWIHDGRIVMDAPPKEVGKSYLADIYRQQQVVASTETGGRSPRAEADRFDMRRDLLLHSNLRNDIEIAEFVASDGFGAGGAEIIDAAILDQEGRALAWMIGGEVVRLMATVAANSRMASVIVGFVVKDRNGQPLFGDNTYLACLESPWGLEPGSHATVTFEFRMPVLPRGAYAISLAVSDGTQESHVVHQWLHDAILFNSHASSVATGLVGLPMLDIQISLGNDGNRRKAS